MGRVLGVDPGDVRIGLALSDPAGITAQPLDVLDATDQAADARAVAERARREDARRIVVGLARNMDGTEGAAAEAARAFAEAIRGCTDAVVDLWDERLSTVEAERRMREAGARRRTVRSRSDMVAAAVMLASYLEAHRS